jgi:ABC-type polysaccharide/polyol phosphate transport system ATPase subunit
LSTETSSGTEAPLASGESRPGADQSPAPAPAIVAAGLSKTFRIPHNAPVTLKERALHPFRRVEVEELAAVRDVNFEIAKGEFFGIVGRNGSGKSTLLKLIAGIYKPNGGEIHVDGRISPFIELGVGFHPELAARDNIVINCSLLGLSRAEALRRFDRIIEFAELERFVDLKLKNYSSGMQVRLAFSTAIQVDADILLLDEVLAVGDSRFQEKCFGVFRQMKAEGRTIVLVTHSMDVVQRFCDRVMLIDRGEQLALGEPREVIDRYLRESARAEPSKGEFEETGHYGDGSAQILEAWFEDGSGKRVEASGQGEPLRICASAVFHAAMEHPVFGIQLRNERGELVFSVNTIWDRIETPSFEAGRRVRFAVAIENVLSIGVYHADVGIAYQDGLRMADLHEGMATLAATGDRWTPAAVELPHELTVEPLE